MSGFGASGAGARMQMRPGGGFRQSFGSFSDEHENENAAAAAAAQKQATQQSSVLGQTGVTKQQAAAAPTSQPAQTDSAVSSEFGKYQAQPRNVTFLKEELLTRPGKDILTTFKSFFDINLLLNINQADSPEKKAKKQKIAHNWQKLTAEEQAYVRQQLQEQQQKKQQELQAEEQKKEEQAKLAEETNLAPPSSPKNGPIELTGSKKQQAATLLQSRRTQMTQVDG